MGLKIMNKKMRADFFLDFIIIKKILKNKITNKKNAISPSFNRKMNKRIKVCMF